MKKIRNNNPNYFLFACSLFIILYGVIYLVAPPYFIDDFWYLRGSYGVESRWEATKIVWQNCLNHWHYDTGRLANLISAPFLALFPKWLFTLCFCFMLGLLIYNALKLTKVKMGSAESWIILFAICFLMPWNDSMVSIIYALNYVWSIALMGSVFYLIVKNEEHNIKYSKLKLCALTVFSFLAAWMHEGITVPFICALVAYYAILKRLPNRANRVLICGVLLGALAIICSEAFQIGSGRYNNILDTSFLMRLLVLYVNIALVLPVALIAVLCTKKLRNKVFADRNNAALIAALSIYSLAGVVIFLKYYHGPRVAFICEYYTVLAFVALSKYINFNKLKFAKLKSAFALFTTLAIAINMGYTIYKQVLFTRDYNEVTKLYLQSKDGIVYYDLEPSCGFDLSLHKGTHSQFELPAYYGRNCRSYFYSKYFSYGTERPLVDVRPTSEQPKEK
jgi:hypothetical protein